MSFRRLDRTTIAVAAALATLAGAGTALAQSATTDTGTPVSSTGKGIVGGALLGGEVVDITMGAIGVEKGWPYFVFGGLGAVGGGIGGHFVETASSSAEPSLYMLAGGMALLIPALVVSLNATAYKPPETDRGEPVNNEPAVEPPKGKATLQVTTSRETPGLRFRSARMEPPIHVPMSLFDVYRGQVAFGVPAFEIRPLYTQREMAQFGVGQGQEVRVPLFKAVF
jgi:hypothetical protein